MVVLREGCRPIKVLRFLLTGPKTQKEICDYLGMERRQMRGQWMDNRLPYKPYSYYPSWPMLRFRLRGGRGHGCYYPLLIDYNRHTRKYSLAPEGRKLVK
jgi:hypothetical protein